MQRIGDPSINIFPFDRWVLGCAVALILIGFVMIGSASMDVALEGKEDPYYYLKRQGAFIVFACLVGYLVWLIPIKFWQSQGFWLMLIALILLVVVLVPSSISKEVNGSRRWLDLGINLQVSELAKVCMVLYAGGYLVRHLEKVRTSWSGILWLGIPLGFFVLLLLLEPDFGATGVLIFTVGAMLFLSGIPMLQVILMSISVPALLGMIAIVEPYRLKRLTSYLEPWSDPYGAGYQLSQAQIAFARGDWFGTGLGNSVQKLWYLPEAHTDFVFAVLAEELGFIGVLALIIIYSILVFRLFLIGRRAEKLKSFFMAYVTYGFAIIFASQTLINIGVNVGALPTKGLTLPLVSYGGSSLVASCIMLAIVLRIDSELRKHSLSKTQQSNSDNKKKLRKFSW